MLALSKVTIIPAEKQTDTFAEETKFRTLLKIKKRTNLIFSMRELENLLSRSHNKVVELSEKLRVKTIENVLLSRLQEKIVKNMNGRIESIQNETKSIKKER